MRVAGHLDTELWHRFDLPNGGWDAYSQAHVGHVIQLINGHWTDLGPCTVCHGQKVCPTCRGKGTVQKKFHSHKTWKTK